MEDLTSVLQLLNKKYSFYSRKDSHEEFPWDRGYRTGYATAIKNVINILSKINDERDYPVYCLRENNALNDMSDKAEELFDIAYNKATKIIDKLDDNYLIENDVIPFIYQDKKDDGTGRVTVKYCKDSYEGTIVDFVVEKVG